VPIRLLLDKLAAKPIAHLLINNNPLTYGFRFTDHGDQHGYQR
jgi:citrate lyase synthetase